MKMYVISDNIDTQMGLRLVGIEGEVVHTKEELHLCLDRLYQDSEIGVVLLTTLVLNLDPEEIYQQKLNRVKPLLVEIPDRHGSVDIGEVIDTYISAAIGMKV